LVCFTRLLHHFAFFFSLVDLSKDEHPTQCWLAKSSTAAWDFRKTCPKIMGG